jgi:multidrug efflux system membrane fusion protein
MKKILPALLVGAALGGGGVWLATRHAAEAAAEAGAPAIEVKPSSAELAKLITEAGIAVGPVGAAQYAPESTGYGRVLDTGAFLSARADVAAAQATAEGSQKEFLRLKSLHDNGENASAQAVETAESAALRDRAQLAVAQARLQAAWGTILPGNDAEATLRLLGAGAAALVRVDLMAGDAAPAGSRARVSPLTGDTVWKDVEFLGPAVATDPQFQGRGWIAVWRDQPAAAGTALRAIVPSGAAPQAVIVVPRKAVVYFQGGTCVYTPTSDGGFERKLVTLGPVLESGVIVSEGLAANDKVVVSGAQQLLATEILGSAPEE